MKTTAQEEDRAAAQVELKRAYLLVEYGEIDDALQACDAAAQLAASVSTPTVLKGAILTGIGRHKEALALLRQATRRWPDALCEAPPAWMDAMMKGRIGPHMLATRSLSFGGRWLGPRSIRPLEEVFGQLDLRRVDLTNANINDEGMRALARASFMRRVSALRLRRNALGAAGIEAMVSSGMLARLTQLDLGHNTLNVRAVQALADASDGGSLRDLRLDGCVMSVAAIDALTRAPWISQLQTLTLQDARLDDALLRRLLWHADWSSLRHLNLASNPLTGEGVAPLARLSSLEGLTWLSLARCPIGAAGIDALCDAPLPALRTLSLAQVSAEGASVGASLARAPWAATLHQLNLADNALGDAGVALMLRHPWPALTALDLSANELSTPNPSGAALPVTLQSLTLDRNPLTQLGGVLSPEALPALRALSLSHCVLHRDSLEALLAADGLATLTHLNLSGNTLNDVSLRSWRAMVAPALRELDLTRCASGAELVQGLARARLPALERLTLSAAFGLKSEHVRALERASWRHTVRALCLAQVSVDHDMVRALAHVFAGGALELLQISDASITRELSAKLEAALAPTRVQQLLLTS